MTFDSKHEAILTIAKTKILDKIPEVLAIYVFGSFGTKYERKDSDVDLAVLSNQKINAVALWNIAQEIAIEIDRDVDLIDITTASTIFRHQIVATGTRFFCKDIKRCDFIESIYISMYLKFKDDRALYG